MYRYSGLNQFYASSSDLFAEDYKGIPALYNGRNDAETINRSLPGFPFLFGAWVPRPVVQAFDADLRNAVRSDLENSVPTHPLRIALQENDVYDWTPRSPVRLYHCTGDEQVPVENSLLAYESFRSRHVDVNLIHPDETLFDPDALGGNGHVECAVPSLNDALAWFNQFRSRKSWTNSAQATDVNNDGRVNAGDIAPILAEMAARGSERIWLHLVSPPLVGTKGPYLDVNQDGFLTPEDADLVQIEMNRADRFCDFDLDGKVNQRDKTILDENWTGAIVDGSGTATFGEGDCDGDGDVDTIDKVRLILAWTDADRPGLRWVDRIRIIRIRAREYRHRSKAAR